MMALSLLADPQAESQVETIARTFGVDWPHLIAQTISFSIVCALLYWLAYKPVLRMLAARREQVALGLANTEKINAALASIESQRKEVLATARAEATRLIAEARDVGKTVKEQEAQRAVLAAEQVLTKAREAAAQERTNMITEARREVGRLVVQTTAAVTGKVLTPDDHTRLAQETARQLGVS